MGFSMEQTRCAFLEASEASQTQDMTSLWLAVVCRFIEDQIYGLSIHSNSATLDHFAVATTRKHKEFCTY